MDESGILDRVLDIIPYLGWGLGGALISNLVGRRLRKAKITASLVDAHRKIAEDAIDALNRYKDTRKREVWREMMEEGRRPYP